MVQEKLEVQKNPTTNTHLDQKNIKDKAAKLFISMKNITKQYQDLLEGKMSRANFMTNARREFPQWISPVNSFADAVSVLKSKRIISEDLGTAQADFDAKEQGLEEAVEITPEAIEQSLKDLFEDGLIDDITLAKASKALPHFNIEDHKNMAGTDTPETLAKELIFIATGEHVEDIQQEPDEDEYVDLGDVNMEGVLNEAEKKDPSIDQVSYPQLVRGTEFEMSKMPMLSDENYEKAKQKAYKALLKNPNAYRHLFIANYDEVEKKDASLRNQEVKKDNLNDKANEQKTLVKNVKGNTKDNLGKKEKAKGTPEGVKMMKEADLTKSSAGLNTLQTSDLAKRAKEIHDKKEAERKASKLKTELHDDDKLSDAQAAEEAVEMLMPNLEGNTYKKSQLDDAFATLEDKYGEHYSNEAFQEAIKMLKEKGFDMAFSEASKADELKAEMLREFQQVPETQIRHSKGHLVKTPEGKMGTIEELTHDGTATVRHDDGSMVDYQTNVLKKPDEMPKEEEKKVESREEIVNKLKEAIKKMMDEAITAKTGDAAHDTAVMQKIGKIPNPSAKADIATAFKTGKSVDI